VEQNRSGRSHSSGRAKRAASPARAQIVLEPIIVEGATLQGDPIQADKLGASATVITGAELERRQIRHATDALRMVPGLAVNRTGGAGAVTQVRIRGAEGNQVKVILDGVEVNSLDAGDFDFSTLLAADIERIGFCAGRKAASTARAP
jgi:vitamin B12 transporter